MKDTEKKEERKLEKSGFQKDHSLDEAKRAEAPAAEKEQEVAPPPTQPDSTQKPEDKAKIEKDQEKQRKALEKETEERLHEDDAEVPKMKVVKLTAEKAGKPLAPGADPDQEKWYVRMKDGDGKPQHIGPFNSEAEAEGKIPKMEEYAAGAKSPKK